MPTAFAPRPCKMSLGDQLRPSQAKRPPLISSLLPRCLSASPTTPGFPNHQREPAAHFSFISASDQCWSSHRPPFLHGTRPGTCCKLPKAQLLRRLLRRGTANKHLPYFRQPCGKEWARQATSGILGHVASVVGCAQVSPTSIDHPPVALTTHCDKFFRGTRLGMLQKGRGKSLIFILNCLI